MLHYIPSKAPILSFLFLLFWIGVSAHTSEKKIGNATDSTSLFDHIYQMEGVPSIKINTDYGYLLRKSMKEEYQPAKVIITNSSGEMVMDSETRIRTRGNMRKQVCGVPPIKIDFTDEELQQQGFLSMDDLKFIFPCGRKQWDQTRLYKEYLVYQMYDVVGEHGMRVKLINVEFIDDDDTKYDFVGMLVEDEEEYARRKNAKIVEVGKLSDGGLDRDSFLKMTFFQYMIANTDWTVPTKHNLEIVKIPGVAKVMGIPYDFDYCGFVGHKYAVPHSDLPIKSVHERYFFPYEITEKEFYEMVEYYQSVQDDITGIIANASYLDERAMNDCQDYVSDFFKLLENPKRLKKSIVTSR
ncbi:MAG: hypothetical protein KJP00_01450 [Bacteroidia bacterium]|nr:hypothetical protein [Bacteroidia bacterium]